MAIQTLNTIKQWFKTGLKPSQAQFWDTWDSFRHKNEKIPVKDVVDLNELLNSKTEETDFKTINGKEIVGFGDITIEGNSQDLQSVLNNGKTWISENSAFLIDHPVLGFGYQGSDGKNAFVLQPEYLSIVVKDSDVNNSIALYMEKPTKGQILDFKLPNTKPTGQYTIATLDDITIAEDSKTLEQVLAKGNTDTTGNSIIMKKEWNETKVKFDSISMSYGNENYGFDHFTLASLGDGGYIDYTDMNGSSNVLNFRSNTTGEKRSFDFPSDTPFTSSTLAVREDITLQKALENNSNGIVQKNIYIGYEELDETTFSTIMMKKSDSEAETGMGIRTSGALDISAERINITSYNSGGSIKTGLINQDNTFEINANNSKLHLKGGSGGIEIQGQAGILKLSGSDFGDGGIQMLSRLGVGRVKNITESNLEISSDTELILNSSKKTVLSLNSGGAAISLENNGQKPYLDLKSDGSMRLSAENGKINILAGTDFAQGITVNDKHIVRTVNGIEADVLGNIILSDLGDMTTNTDQEVFGVKTFLNTKLALRNIANTFSSFLSNSNTASRTYSLQDKSGTLMLSDAGNSNLTGYGQAVQLLSANGTPTRGGNIVNLFSFVQATPVTLNNATLNSILTGTIFGNTTLISNTNPDNPMLTTGKSFSGKMFGYINAISSETFNIVLKIGSTTLLDSSILVIPSTLINKSFEINYSFTVLSEGITGTMIANLNIMIDGMNIYSISGNPVDINTTMNRVFDIQFAYGAINTGNSITFKLVKGSNDVN